MTARTGQDWIDPADYWEENVGWSKFVDAVMSQRYRGRLTARRIDPSISVEPWIGDDDAVASADAPCHRQGSS